MDKYIIVIFVIFFSLASNSFAEVIRDPTIPIDYIPIDNGGEKSYVDENGLRLTVIYVSNDKSAVINGKKYRIGDMVNGYRIETIKPREVLLSKDGTTLVLSLFNKNNVVIK